MPRLLDNPSLLVAAALAAFELVVFVLFSIDMIVNRLPLDGMTMLIAVHHGRVSP